MPLDIKCPNCLQAIRFQDPASADGKVARCPSCSQTFTVQIPKAELESQPVDVEGLGGAATAGATTDGSFWREAMKGSSGGPTGTTTAPPGAIWKVVIENIRLTFDAAQLRSMGRSMANVGTYGMIGGMVLFSLYWIVIGLKGQIEINWFFVFFGLVGPVGLTAIQFINQRLLTAIEGQIDSARTRVSTTAIFDALGILFLLLALGSPIVLFYVALNSKLYFYIFVGLAGFVVFSYLSLVSLNPEFLNIHLDTEATAADDALALYAFLAKVYISAIPLQYGILMILGCAGLAMGILQISLEAQANWATTVHLGGVSAFHMALVLPFLGYVTGILALLSVFVLQATLSIPVKAEEIKDKLDELKKTGF
jgi:predicted Zn finger-like uncharacterized protein